MAARSGGISYDPELDLIYYGTGNPGPWNPDQRKGDNKWTALAPDNPWGAETLDWATTSPPPSYNFLHPPTVRGRSPLWEQGPDQPVIVGLSTDRREALVTKLLDAEPDHRDVVPGPSLWPLMVALGTGVTFIGVIFNPWAFVGGLILMAIPLIGWFWPKGEREMLEEQP